MPRQEIETNGLRWVHINKPNDNDLRYLENEHHLDQIVIQAIATPTAHPALEEFSNSIYFVLHFPIIYPTKRHNSSIEIDFVLTSRALITITYQRYSRLEDLWQKCKTDQHIQAQYWRIHSGYILYLVLDRLYQIMIDYEDFIDKELVNLEKEIFSSPRHSLLEKITYVVRDILDFRRIFATQGDVLQLLPPELKRLHGKDTVPRFANLLVTQSRVQRLIDNHKDTVDSLHETYESLIGSRISRIVTVLTLFSGFILPMSLIASIWGMNHQVMPLRDGLYDFWLILGLMFLTGIILFLGFKRARWI